MLAWSMRPQEIARELASPADSLQFYFSAPFVVMILNLPKFNVWKLIFRWGDFQKDISFKGQFFKFRVFILERYIIEHVTPITLKIMTRFVVPLVKRQVW